MADSWTMCWDRGERREMAGHEDRCYRCHEVLGFYSKPHKIEDCIEALTERMERAPITRGGDEG